MCNGCNGFTGDDTVAELVAAILSADPCKAWNVILTFVLGNRNVHLANQHRQNMLTLPVQASITSLTQEDTVTPGFIMCLLMSTSTLG